MKAKGNECMETKPNWLKSTKMRNAENAMPVDSKHSVYTEMT